MQMKGTQLVRFFFLKYAILIKFLRYLLFKQECSVQFLLCYGLIFH